MEGPSDKQKSLIEALSNGNNVNFFEYASNHLKRGVKTYQDLNSKELSNVINSLRYRHPVSIRQIIQISCKYKLEDINRFFTADFKEYSELKYWHYATLMLSDKKFTLDYKDIPLLSNIDYEYGWQKSDICPDGKFYYLKFYDLMMLDYDNVTYSELIKILEEWKSKYTFKIYKTFRGYHVYLVSELINHKNAKQLMEDLKCDYWYLTFAASNGYKIRLSVKLEREEEYIEKFIGIVGDKPIHPEIKNLLDVHGYYLEIANKKAQEILKELRNSN